MSKGTVEGLFEPDADHDFAALDTFMPHPIYGAQSWVSILNPGPATTDLAERLLTEAHGRAAARHERRGS